MSIESHESPRATKHPLISTYDRSGEARSRIVLRLTPGNIVTTPRTDVMYVVTGHGWVNLKGKSVAERARALISIAHPKFREQLEREAHSEGLIPPGFLRHQCTADFPVVVTGHCKVFTPVGKPALRGADIPAGVACSKTSFTAPLKLVRDAIES